MTSVNVTTQKNTVTVQQGDATTVTVTTQGAQGAAGAGISAGDKGALTVAANLTDWTLNKPIDFGDNEKIRFGNSQDLEIFHDGLKSTILDNGTGGLALRGENTISMGDTTGNRVYLQAIKNGSVSLRHNNVVRLETTADGVDLFNRVRCLGGTAPRIQFFGDVNGVDTTTRGTFGLATGANQIVHGTTTNDVALNTPRKFFIGHASQEVMAKFDPDGAVELFFDNVKKCETSVDGLKVDATLAINSGSGTLMALRLQNDVTGTANTDGAAITYSTNSHGYFFSAYETNGNMIFQTGGSQMNNRTLLISQTGVVTLQRNQEPMLVATPNAGVELYHNNVKRCETSANGLDLPDNSKLQLGDSQDLQLYHDSNNSVIDSNTGNLYLQSANNLFIQGANNENVIKYVANGALELYHDGTKKAETTSSGITVTGTVTASTGAVIGGSTFSSDGTLTTTAAIIVENSQPGISFNDTGANPDFIIQNRDGSFAIRDTTNNANRFLVNMANGELTTTGSIIPDADNTDALGSSSKRFTTLHSAALNTGDINMSNLNDSGNEVDGSKGSWTLQEGADDLFIINRVSGKKYKFNLTEIS